MSEADVREQVLRMAWLERQMEKADFDANMELRKLTRQTWSIALAAFGLVVGAFAAGATWATFFFRGHG
jgi:hypothetical protein